MRVIVVGAGFGGVAAAVELTSHGHTDVTVLDGAGELGGTWLKNTYPGAACDVPSHFYSFSFAQRSRWSRLCSPQPEILDYLRAVARDHGVDRLVVPDQRVTAARWDEATRTWTVTAQASDQTTTERVAEALVVATGQLDQPAYPRIEGLGDFAGHAFHSARWDHDHDLTGRRVAVIGTGASAVQLLPEVAEAAAHTTVFQRTGNWFLPRRARDYSGPVRAVLAVPGLRRVFRAALAVSMELITAAVRHPRTLGRVLALWSWLFMRGQLRDADVRRTAWPGYTFGCKRVLFSSAYLPTLQRPDVTLVGEPITRMTPAGPQTPDGRVHEVDTVVFGTGFATTGFMSPMEVTGAGGRRLAEEWRDGAWAHLGITVPGFPNLFLLYGPNTNTSGGSIIFFLERQARYVRQALDLLRRRGAEALDVRRDVARSGDRALQRRFEGTAWTRCDSWYRNAAGRIVTNWPGYMREYAAATREVDEAEYRLLGRRTSHTHR